MIGLEFIANVFNKTYSEIAKEIGVSNQTITDWIKGKTPKIPEKRIKDLKAKIPEFGNIKEELFSKELTPADKQEITTVYLIVDIQRRAEKVLEENSKDNEKMLETLKYTIDMTDIAKKGIVTQINVEALNFIIEHLLESNEFMEELGTLIIKHEPSFEKYWK